MRNGVPIEQVGLRGGVDPKISYSKSFAEWEAAHAANADLYKWDYGDYPVEFKAKVLAWKQLRDLVQAHKEDAAYRESKRKSRR